MISFFNLKFFKLLTQNILLFYQLENRRKVLDFIYCLELFFQIKDISTDNRTFNQDTKLNQIINRYFSTNSNNLFKVEIILKYLLNRINISELYFKFKSPVVKILKLEFIFNLFLLGIIHFLRCIIIKMKLCLCVSVYGGPMCQSVKIP